MVYNYYIGMSTKEKNNSIKRQPVWKCVSGILKLFFKKPKIVTLSDKLPERAIYVANHSAMFGPLMYSLYLPVKTAAWGAHPMLGNYKSRYHYLRDVYFIQKRHKSKFAATLLAFFEAFFSPWFYKGMRVIPSYNDSRLLVTLRKSMRMLNNNISVIIYPEDSSEGYHEVLTDFFAGFVELAKFYAKNTGEDIPICPAYYHAKKKVMVIGKPQYLSDYTSRGLGRKEIAKEFCNIVNNLFLEHIKD